MISESFKNAVETKNTMAVKSSFYTIILSDPGFKTGKFDEALKYVKDNNFAELFDSHNGEEILPESEWTEEYFDLLASKLQDNFSEERISQIKYVAKVVYPSEQSKVKVVNNAESTKSTRYTTSKTEKDEDNSLIVFVGIVAAGLLVVHLISKLFKGDD